MNFTCSGEKVRWNLNPYHMDMTLTLTRKMIYPIYQDEQFQTVAHHGIISKILSSDNGKFS